MKRVTLQFFLNFLLNIIVLNGMKCPEISGGKKHFSTENGCYYVEDFTPGEKCLEPNSFIAELWDDNINDVASKLRQIFNISSSTNYFLLNSLTNTQLRQVTWKSMDKLINISYTERPVYLNVKENSHELVGSFTGQYVLCRIFSKTSCSPPFIATQSKCLKIISAKRKESATKCEENGLILADIENDTSVIYFIKTYFLKKNTTEFYSIYFDQKTNVDQNILWPSGNVALENTQQNVFGIILASKNVNQITIRYDDINNALCEKKTSSVEGDPHFKHFIAKLNSYICYDVTGTPNENLLLIHHLPSKTKIYGQFRDDYYFGKIIISNDKNFTIKSDDLWEPRKQIDVSFSSSIEFLSRNRLLLKIKESGNNEMLIEIKKGINSINTNHLDLNLLKADKKNLTGLIGFVENTKFEIFEGSQNPNTGSIRKMDKVFPIKKVVRNGYKCWFLDFKHILYPLNRQHFFI